MTTARPISGNPGQLQRGCSLLGLDGIRRKLGCATVAGLSVLAGLASMAAAPATAQAGLTPRTCTSKIFGDRKIDFCIRGWVDDSNDHTRAVAELHTYRYAAGGGAQPGAWVDVRARSITLNTALLAHGSSLETWGANGVSRCRINGPAGTVGCSVPNATRVAFYSADRRPDGTRYYAGIYGVSFRDDRGVAHYATRSDTTIIDSSWQP